MKTKVLKRLAIVAAVGLASAGCVTGLNPVQKQEYQAYQTKGLLVEDKSPGLAAGLSVVPVLSLGYYYNGEVVYGILNAVNPLWLITEPFDAYKAAENTNYYATKMAVAKQLRVEMRQLDDLRDSHQVAMDEYFKRKKEIEVKYSPDEF